jgi:D-alanine-D-alanine ligase
VSIIGNRDKLEILPLTELVFDKEKNLPEERIATKAAKWHEGYRARRGIRNQFARPIAAQTRETIEHICRTAFRILWLRDYARCDVRLASDGQVWLLEANANPYISNGHDFAESAGKSGLAYAALIQRLVETAQERFDFKHA